jgi:hypothetical protein
MAAADGISSGLVAEWGWESSSRPADWAVTSASAALVLLNLLDGLFTLVFLQLGVAEEANPLMRAAYEHSPILFMSLKLAVVHAGVALLNASRQASPARLALGAGALLYAGILVYHLAFLTRLISG